MTPTRAPARAPARPASIPVDPRIRVRRAAVTRQKGRRRRRLLLGVVVLLGVVTGGWFVLHTRVFAARVVTVRGAVHTPVTQIETVAGVSSHPPLIDVVPGTVASRLERLPWIATANVQREWPDGLRITVVERTPAAVIRNVQPIAGTPSTSQKATSPATSPSPAAPGWAVVDRSGRVLTDVASPPAGLVPVVAPVSPGAPGTDVGAGAAPGLAVASSLPKAFSAQVTGVDVGHGGAVTLTLTTPVTVDLGNVVELRQKYEDVAAILAGAKLAAGDVIDVSVPQAPAVDQG
ncbi:MAG: cell division protein FtsQ/DivIB [Acidimicrobiales bacterium]